jgi:hypothetical protein
MQPKDTRSVGDLFVELSQQISTLVRQEIALAQTEVRQNVTQLSRDVILLVVGGAIAYAGFIGLILGGIIALAQALSMPWWQAGLIIGGGVAIVGIILMIAGRIALGRVNLAPRKTVASLKQAATDVAHVRERVPA